MSDRLWIVLAVFLFGAFIWSLWLTVHEFRKAMRQGKDA